MSKEFGGALGIAPGRCNGLSGSEGGAAAQSGTWKNNNDAAQNLSSHMAQMPIGSIEAASSPPRSLHPSAKRRPRLNKVPERTKTAPGELRSDSRAVQLQSDTSTRRRRHPRARPRPPAVIERPGE